MEVIFQNKFIEEMFYSRFNPCGKKFSSIYMPHGTNVIITQIMFNRFKVSFVLTPMLSVYNFSDANTFSEITDSIVLVSKDS